MTKALVVNGLNRSGTTMMERVIDSQPGMVCFTLVFQMLKMIVQLRGLSDKGEIIGESFTEGRNVLTPETRPALRNHLIMDYASALYGLASHERYASLEDGTVWGLARRQLHEIMELIARHETVEDVASLLLAIGDHVELRVTSTRWTGHHRYAPVFLANPSSYWLEIARNPYARISSERISHGGHLGSVLFHMRDSFQFAAHFRHERFRVVRYEDLCNNPDECLAGLSEWLGEEIRNVDLKTPLGGPFRPNTSDNITRSQDLYHQDPEIPARIGALDNERWRQRMSQRDIALINRSIDSAGFYEKEVATLPACVQAFADFAWLKAAEAAKTGVRSALRPLGYTVLRLPQERVL